MSYCSGELCSAARLSFDQLINFLNVFFVENSSDQQSADLQWRLESGPSRRTLGGCGASKPGVPGFWGGLCPLEGCHERTELSVWYAGRNRSFWGLPGQNHLISNIHVHDMINVFRVAQFFKIFFGGFGCIWVIIQIVKCHLLYSLMICRDTMNILFLDHTLHDNCTFLIITLITMHLHFYFNFLVNLIFHYFSSVCITIL